MTVAARKLTHISATEYLAAENDGAWRHEFVNGAVYAMAWASDRHNLLRGNLAAFLLDRLPDHCQVFTADMKLQIRTNDQERYYCPDLFVACDPADRDRYVRKHASLVAEILSPSTERIDRTEKFEAYQTNPAVTEYALLSQDAVELELFRRPRSWQREFFRQDNTVTFESVGLTTNVSTFYRRVGLDLA
ncbi:MAG: Uma2 family endonuclease [Hyphomicrobiaceae bacterium]|nr:Uma2 family endonuclease [Hyphomicrobiaceae bacterium]